MAFVFCGLTMNAVGRAAQKMVNEVRRQFREIKGIMDRRRQNRITPVVWRFLRRGAQHEMVFPVFAGYYYSDCCGIDFWCIGCNRDLLAGGLGSGFVLAVFMANSGGAWDNAKKYVEEGHLGGKGSDMS